MTSARLGRALGACVAAVAILNTLSALSLPVPERKPGILTVLVWLVLLVLHAMLYWFGDRVRERTGLRAMWRDSPAIIFAVCVTVWLIPVIGLLGVLPRSSKHLRRALGYRFESMGSDRRSLCSALSCSRLYRAATRDFYWPFTGVTPHGVAHWFRSEPAPVESTPAPAPAEWRGHRNPLSPRRLKSGGSHQRARSIDSATSRYHSERVRLTWLRIYTELGVDSGARAAVACSTRRCLDAICARELLASGDIARRRQGVGAETLTAGSTHVPSSSSSNGD